MRKDLPPVIKRYVVPSTYKLTGKYSSCVISIDERKQPHLSQNVPLTGFNTSNFQLCIDNIQKIHQLLARQVPDGMTEPLRYNDFTQSNSITMGACHFTSRREDPFGTAVPFDKAVDPRDILSSMKSDNYFHGEDNNVRYYTMTHEGTGRR
jgi:hypothetical protein